MSVLLMSPLPSAVWPAASILYPLYRDDRHSPARARPPSARKVAWLSDRTRPFAPVLVQSDDPADTPLGPFGHLGVACATRPRSMRKWPSHGGKVFYAGSRSSWAIRWAISLSLPTRTVTPRSCRGGSGWDWKSSGGKTRRIIFHRLAGEDYTSKGYLGNTEHGDGQQEKR